MVFQCTIRNVGFAPIYNERKVYLVLRNQGAVFPIQLVSDPRRWLPNGAETQINETLTLPADIPAGTYHLYLHLPDMASSLAADPRYAVRFANVGVWDAMTGMNNLNASVTVTEGTSGVSTQRTMNRPTKRLFNGQLIIERNGERYTAQGTRL